MNIFYNGQEICLTTHSNELAPIKAFTTGKQDMLGVVMTITWDSTALSFASYTASQGTFAETGPGTGDWTIGTLTGSLDETPQDVDNPETLDLCFTILDNTLAPFIINFVVTCDNCPDNTPDDNLGFSTFEGIECSDFLNCLNVCELEYDTLEQAVEFLGLGQPYVASLHNSEGRDYRELVITPCTNPFFEPLCPEDMIIGSCGVDIQDNVPTVGSACGDLVFNEVTNFAFDTDTGTYSWDGSYVPIDCTECPELPQQCCVEDGYTVYFHAIANLIELVPDPLDEEEPIEDVPRYLVTFYIYDCLTQLECSYIWQGANC